MNTAPVNKIIPMSVVDGPGNRTAVFLQGCNISCGYCHNPETQRLCSVCGACVKECPAGALSVGREAVIWDEERCVGCDRCINVCKQWSSPKVKFMKPEEVFQEIKKNQPFIRGITVSGGECSLYPEFLTGLFLLARKAKLTCLMDSNGLTDLSQYPKLLEVCDGVMLDVKSWNPQIHCKLTGMENQMVLKNLIMLQKNKKLLEVRIVCKPGVIDAENVIGGIFQCLKESLNFRLKLIPFRPYGVKGFMKDMDPPSEEYMEGLKKLAEDYGYGDVIIV